MSTILRHHCQLAVDRRRVVGRRHFLKAISAAGAAAGALGWTDELSLRADELRQQGTACIVLWMQGGPSQFETFDPKPGHANGGETKAIATSLTGVQFSEHLPRLAGIADRLAVVRSMTTREGEHQRATYLMHTAYLPMASVKYPAMGSVAARELSRPDCELPSFVRIGAGPLGSTGGGFLGTQYDPFVLQAAGRLPENARPASGMDRFDRRLGLLARLDDARQSTVPAAALPGDHQKLYQNAARMIKSAQMEAFDLERETESMRAAYGTGPFASACLLARRLVESGVTFVEAVLGNWDTHQDNFSRTPSLCGQLDQPFAALVTDLADRGMLDKTLVVWMGEFGRTPRINPRGGRDHFPRAFSAVLAGGGIRGGQVLGATEEGGESVKDRPVTEKDLFQTVYQSLGINSRKEYMSPIGRPIKPVDGGQPVSELVG
ncbi:MAG TPA: DUF1501 domain-containing protein [Pirellulales bacterium]|nr:DUF1501 domain-containing protein [Pirellulales bacterium]